MGEVAIALPRATKAFNWPFVVDQPLADANRHESKAVVPVE